MIVFNSCQKEDALDANLQRAPQPLTASCPDYDVQYNTVLGYMNYPDDPADTRINYILYHYAQAVRDAMADPVKRCQMVDALLQLGENGQVSLYEFANNNTSVGAKLNLDIKQSISDNTVYPKGVVANIQTLINDANWDANAFLRGNFIYEGIEYDPIIHFVKAPESCQTDKPVVVGHRH